jgi:hypothetical protein
MPLDLIGIHFLGREEREENLSGVHGDTFVGRGGGRGGREGRGGHRRHGGRVGFSDGYVFFEPEFEIDDVINEIESQSGEDEIKEDA